MTDKACFAVDDLLKNTEVQEVISDINPELLARRAYAPAMCDVFERPYTVLTETDAFRFFIDPAFRPVLISTYYLSIPSLHI